MSEKVCCRPVVPGSTVAVVALSSPVEPSLYKQGIAELEGLGFKVREYLEPGRKWRYLAGPDDHRLAQLRLAFEDEAVSCVFLARGGYGCARLLDRLQPSWFSASPRIVVGASDATALLNFLVEHSGIPCVHGPMPAQDMRRGESAFDAPTLMRLLGDPNPLGELSPEGVVALRSGRSDGVLIGGCMSVLCSLIGTPFEVDPRGKILLLEDKDEKPYRIDRMLTQMRLAGWFDELRGLIFGQMPGCVQHPEQGYTLEEVLLERLEGTVFPVLYGFPAGHVCAGRHTALPLGVRVELDAVRGKVTVMEALVR